MNRQLDHMVRLIDDLLDVSRISRGMLELKKERAQLSAILDTALDSSARCWRSDARRRSSTHRRRSSRWWIRRGSPRSSATSYTTRSSTPPRRARSACSLSREADDAVIRVSDTALALGEMLTGSSTCSRASIRRWRDRTAGWDRAGARAASRQDARWNADGGEPGSRSRQHFTLRVPTGSSPTPRSRATRRRRRGARPLNGSLDILIIEDNVDAAETMALWLQHMGTASAWRTPDNRGSSSCSTRSLSWCCASRSSGDGRAGGLPPRARGRGTAPIIMVALTGWGMEEIGGARGRLVSIITS